MRFLHQNRALIALAALLCVLVSVGLALSVALAHTSKGGMAYEPYCCNGRDCAEIPESAIRTTPQGWEVTLTPGMHPMVTKRVKHLIPYGSPGIRASKDEEWHICLYPTQDDVRCFYVLGGGM